MTSEPHLSLLDDYLSGVSLPVSRVEKLGDHLQDLVNAKLDRLPLPGQGQTLGRWRALSRVAAYDLGLAKLFEGHTDALAIMAELNAPDIPEDNTWGMWAAEPPYARVTLSLRQNGDVELVGRKAWCSGARVLSHALMTAWDGDDRQNLVAVALDQPGVRVTESGWQAVGMAPTASVEVVFDRALATPIGEPGDYMDRPGFWQGGAGIAACWYGAATYIGDTLRTRCAEGGGAHSLAHLGAVDGALSTATAALRETAAWIDSHPRKNAVHRALRTRAVMEEAVTGVMEHAGKALGAAPFCRNLRFARMMADLPVFVRQSHAERDLEALGKAVALEDFEGWHL